MSKCKQLIAAFSARFVSKRWGIQFKFLVFVSTAVLDIRRPVIIFIMLEDDEQLQNTRKSVNSLGPEGIHR